MLLSKSKFSYLRSTNTSRFVQLWKKLRFPESEWMPLNVSVKCNMCAECGQVCSWGRKCGFKMTAMTCNRPGSQSVELWLHHLVGADKWGLMMAVTRGKVSVFLCQLLGFQPDTGQRGCDYDLIPRRSFSPKSPRNSSEKWVSGDAHSLKKR